MTISYPSESFSIELHILIMVIATIITVVGLVLGYFWTKKQTQTSQGGPGSKASTTSTTSIGTKSTSSIRVTDSGGIPGWKDVLKDIIPATGIILAFISPVISSVFNPILDYSVIPDTKNNTKLYVKIDNFGLVNAKNIEVYFYAEGKNFTGFYSIPVIFNGTSFKNSDKLGIGNGIFYIPTLPPRSETLVTALTNKTLAPDDKVIVYVRSDISTGVHNVGFLTVAYLVYAGVLTFNTLFIMLTDWLWDKEDRLKHKKYRDILIAVDLAFILAIFLVIFFGACEGSGDCLSHGINFH